jgi:hypothetical protein
MSVFCLYFINEKRLKLGVDDQIVINGGDADPLSVRPAEQRLQIPEHPLKRHLIDPVDRPDTHRSRSRALSLQHSLQRGVQYGRFRCDGDS